jgi:predicted Fe-S protein YdhL (DUF1289 family)
MSETLIAAGVVASPCVGVCRLTEEGLCEGCLRSIDEITAWGRLDEAARRAIVVDLERRRRSVTG